MGRSRLIESIRNSHRHIGTSPTAHEAWSWLADEVHNPELAALHENYVTRVSSPDMAISLETAELLTLICEKVRPQRILDLGSGFSSLVFRRYAKTRSPAPLVLSVDDSEVWLDKTREYLMENDLDDSLVVSWREFKSTRHGQFDLVLHDLGNMKTRAATLTDAIDCSSETGAVFVDDVHKRSYRGTVKRVAGRRNLRIISLKDQTLDSFQRFGALLVAPPSSDASS